MRTLLSLGGFNFSVNTASFDKLDKSDSYNWSRQQLLGGGEKLQFLGNSNQSISLSGVVFAQMTGDRNSIDLLRDMAKAGTPYLLIDAQGVVHGYYAIAGLSESQDLFSVDGLPVKKTYELDLVYYGDTV